MSKDQQEKQTEYSDDAADANGSDDDEEQEGKGGWLGSSDSDDEKLANDSIMKGEKKLAQIQNEFLDDIREEQGQLDGENKLHLIGREELEAPPVDYDQVRERATQIIITLENFRESADKNISRKSYLDKLYDDLALLYGYNRFLLEKIASLVKISELMDFLDANEHQRPVTIRKNTLRTHHNDLEHILNERGVRLAPVGKWTKLGLMVLESQVPVGATPEYLSGYYMLQSPSSFLPVMALNPKPKSRVLDMCAAPGGKTTHMAQLMNNTGVIVANDFIKARASALIANIHRLGVVNTIVVNYNGKAFPTVMGGFDYVLCDAPCSGTGVISRDSSVKSTKSEQDLMFLTTQQKELILHAYDSVKPTGGKLCYCTCSVLVEENEAVVDYLLKNRDAKCIIPGIDEDFDSQLVKGITRYEGHIFNDQVKNARRVYPHNLNMDGFFFALIDVPHHTPNESKDINIKREKVRAFSRKLGGK